MNATPAFSQYENPWSVPFAEHRRVAARLSRRAALGRAAVLGSIGGEARLLLVVVRAGVVDHAQGAAEFALEVGAGPGFGVDGFERREVAAEGLVGAVELLDALLRLAGLAFDGHERAGELFDHLLAALLQFVLAAAEFFEFALLALDLLLLTAQRKELFLGFLHLVADALRAGGRLAGGDRHGDGRAMISSSSGGS